MLMLGHCSALIYKSYTENSWRSYLGMSPKLCNILLHKLVDLYDIENYRYDIPAILYKRKTHHIFIFHFFILPLYCF